MIPIEIRILQFLKLEKEQREKEIAELLKSGNILTDEKQYDQHQKLQIEIHLLTAISNWIIETFSQPTNTDNINLLRSDNK